MAGGLALGSRGKLGAPRNPARGGGSYHHLNHYLLFYLYLFLYLYRNFPDHLHLPGAGGKGGQNQDEGQYGEQSSRRRQCGYPLENPWKGR